jgi:Fic family protein
VAEATYQFRGEDHLRPAVIPEIVRETALREEAVTSCVLDGLSVDRQHAMEMLESGREPRDRSELAVRQTYLVLRRYLPNRESLSVEGILQLHRFLTEGSTESPDTPGRLRRNGEGPGTCGAAPADVPAPPATELEHRLSELLRFLQPHGHDLMPDSLRAVVAHFWIAYERPFVEGNGRLARVLFYALLQRRYNHDPAGLVSISSRLVRSPGAYADAFRNARTDRDVGYFVHGQLRILNRAVQRLLKTISGIRETGVTLRDRLPGVELNERQIGLLAEARNHPNRRLTIDSHRRRSGVVYQTARTDLLRLVDLELLRQEKEGRAFVFRATGRLAALLDA